MFLKLRQICLLSFLLLFFIKTVHAEIKKATIDIVENNAGFIYICIIYVPCKKDTIKISLDQLLEKFPEANKEALRVLVSTLNDSLREFGITDYKTLALFLAQVAAETNRFREFSENLNYKSPATVRKAFNNHILPGAKDSNLLMYVKNPEKLSDWAYGGRLGNGNETSGDGYRYRGRGFLHLTGKIHYKDFTKFCQSRGDSVNFITDPDLLSTNYKYATLSALWYFSKIVLSGNDHVIAKLTVKEVTWKVNGGFNGLKTREKYYKKILKIFN